MDKKVMVYSTPTCPFCVKTKQFLKDNDIEFEDIDVSADQNKAQRWLINQGRWEYRVLELQGDHCSFDKKDL